MDLVPKIPAGRQLINGYGNGGFRIAGQFYKGSVLLFPERVETLGVGDIALLTLTNFAPLLEEIPPVELLLLGAGRQIAQLEPGLREQLRRRGVAVEALDTGAACRTYNVLLSEDRRIAAALIAVE